MLGFLWGKNLLIHDYACGHTCPWEEHAWISSVCTLYIVFRLGPGIAGIERAVVMPQFGSRAEMIVSWAFAKSQ